MNVKVFNNGSNSLPEGVTAFAASKDVKAELCITRNEKFDYDGCRLVCVHSTAKTGILTESSIVSNNPFEYESLNAVGPYVNLGLVVESGRRCLVKTGIHIEYPLGYRGSIKPRSGLALKYGLTFVNCEGVLDNDYRGDTGMIIINHGEDDLLIVDGERIGQISIEKYTPFNWNLVDDIEQLSKTDRGSNGFGNSGTGINNYQKMDTAKKLDVSTVEPIESKIPRIITFIKEERVKISALQQLVENIGHNSAELTLCRRSLQMGKAWLGIALKQFGTESPYPKDGTRKSVDDIEPEADKAVKVEEFPKAVDDIADRIKQGDFNHIEKVDFLRLEIQKRVDAMNIYIFESFAITKSFEYLIEAKMWLGFELGVIRDNAKDETSKH